MTLSHVIKKRLETGCSHFVPLPDRPLPVRPLAMSVRPPNQLGGRNDSTNIGISSPIDFIIPERYLTKQNQKKTKRSFLIAKRSKFTFPEQKGFVILPRWPTQAHVLMHARFVVLSFQFMFRLLLYSLKNPYFPRAVAFGMCS